MQVDSLNDVLTDIYERNYILRVRHERTVSSRMAHFENRLQTFALNARHIAELFKLSDVLRETALDLRPWRSSLSQEASGRPWQPNSDSHSAVQYRSRSTGVQRIVRGPIALRIGPKTIAAAAGKLPGSCAFVLGKPRFIAHPNGFTA
jgi:hypothetical protein